MLYHFQSRFLLRRFASLLLGINTFMRLSSAIAARLQHEHDKERGLVVRPDMSIVPYQPQPQRMSASWLCKLEAPFQAGQLIRKMLQMLEEPSYKLAPIGLAIRWSALLTQEQIGRTFMLAEEPRAHMLGNNHAVIVSQGPLGQINSLDDDYSLG